MKIDAFYFQAISGVFFVWAGHNMMVRPFVALQPPAQGAALLPCSTTSLLVRRQTALAGGRRAGAAHKFLRRSCAPFATAQTAPVAPLVGPALLGRRQWCIDIHGNPWKLRSIREGNPEILLHVIRIRLWRGVPWTWQLAGCGHDSCIQTQGDSACRTTKQGPDDCVRRKIHLLHQGYATRFWRDGTAEQKGSKYFSGVMFLEGPGWSETGLQ